MQQTQLMSTEVNILKTQFYRSKKNTKNEFEVIFFKNDA